MPSNYTFCGFDMLSPGSQAGKAGYGINLNSVTAQYSMKQNPALAQSVFDGTTPSHFAPIETNPTVTDCGVVDIGSLEEKGSVSTMNPMQLAQATSPFPTATFSGALGMYQDQFQPTSMMPQYPSTMYGGYGYDGYSPNGFMPINYTPPGAVPYNYAPVDPMMQAANSGFVAEWNDYQRRLGFRAPIPESAIYDGNGLLSGFHTGFDPYAALAPAPDQFYDVTAGGRFCLADHLHEQALMNAARIWGWQPGQIIDRREQMMFPGINDDHNDPRPKDGVLDYSGRPQRRLGNSNTGAIPSNSLPISDMVSTNPFMAGMSSVGGFGGMYQQHVPSPYMQARYNYAIANGFQSIQEMDNNDFRVLKMFSRASHTDMEWEEFEQYFDETFCKPLVKKEQKPPVAIGGDNPNVPRMNVSITKGDQVLASNDMSNDVAYRQHVQTVQQIVRTQVTPQMIAQAEAMEANTRAAKDNMMALLYSKAPDREYDKSGMLEYMAHGFGAAIMHGLDLQEDLNRRNPVALRERQMINQTAFMRNTLERGMGIGGLPAAMARIDMENRMFYKGEQLPDEELKDVKRGSYGVYANGQPIEPDTAPMYGYTSYIPDPEHPERSIGFPRKFIEEVYEGYVRYCNSINGHSKSAKVMPMNYDEFKDTLGVSVVDDDEFLARFGHMAGTDRFKDAAKRGIIQDNPDFLDMDVPMDAFETFADEHAEDIQAGKIIPGLDPMLVEPMKSESE